MRAWVVLVWLLVCYQGIAQKALADWQSDLFKQNKSTRPLISSVNPEFMQGLHRKYLDYIAQQLDREIRIMPMPFARRIKALNDGKIDLMIAVSDVRDLGENVIKLYPAYEEIEIGLFTQASNTKRLNSLTRLHARHVAVTRNVLTMPILQGMPDENIMQVSSLKQKIELVLLGRVQAFTHVKDAAQAKLTALGYNNDIGLSDLQPKTVYGQHLAISAFSPLNQDKVKLENMIRAGIASGAFSKIRQKHYAQSASQ